MMPAPTLFTIWVLLTLTRALPLVAGCTEIPDPALFVTMESITLTSTVPAAVLAMSIPVKNP
jgi:hypothetical protein